VNHFTVEHDSDEFGIRYLLAFRIESRADELDFKRLPLTGGLGGVHARRNAVVDVVVARFLFGARIDAAARIAAQLFGAVRIEYLNLVATYYSER
jgi:hypothetical protein